MKLNLLLGTAAIALMGFQAQAQQQCTQVDATDQLWHYGAGDPNTPNPVTQSFSIADPSDGGFTLDVYYLDNSFTLDINGTQISNDELQFQGTNGLTQNVEFGDGTPSWGNSSTPQIWELGNFANTPPFSNFPTILRIVINAAGNVSMSGIDSNDPNATFHPVKLTTGNFNTVTWHSQGNNQFTITQSVDGETGMAFTAYGLNNCTSLGTNEVNFKGFTYNSMVKGQLQLKSNNAIQGVKIYNMTGQLVRTAEPNTGNANINLQGLQSGIYMMNVTINGSTKAYKIVKE